MYFQLVKISTIQPSGRLTVLGDQTKMALIPCKECGIKISDRAEVCPQCGVPLKAKLGCITILLIFLLGIALLYSSCKEMITSQYSVFFEEQFIK